MTRTTILLLLLLPAVAQAQDERELRLEAQRLKVRAELLELEAKELRIKARRLELEAQMRALDAASKQTPKPRGPIAQTRAKIVALLTATSIDPMVRRAVVDHEKQQGKPPSDEQITAYRERLIDSMLGPLAKVFDDDVCASIARVLAASDKHRELQRALAMRQVQQQVAVARAAERDLPIPVKALLQNGAALQRDVLRVLVLRHLLQRSAPTRTARDTAQIERLLAMARIALAAKRPERAAPLLKRLFELDPQHEGGQELAKHIERQVILRYTIARQKWQAGGSPKAFIETARTQHEMLEAVDATHRLLKQMEADVAKAQATTPPKARKADELVAKADHAAAASKFVEAAKLINQARRIAPEHLGATKLARALARRASLRYQMAKQKWQDSGQHGVFIAEAKQHYDLLRTLSPRHSMVTLMAEDLKRAIDALKKPEKRK